jgi:guanylate kinase
MMRWLAGTISSSPARSSSGGSRRTNSSNGRSILESGRSVLLRIELQGARQIKERRPDAVMVFVRAPSLEETRRRLESRATETSESVESRMATAIKEIAAREEFDYEVVNGDREQAHKDMIETLEKIVAGGVDDARS